MAARPWWRLGRRGWRIVGVPAVGVVGAIAAIACGGAGDGSGPAAADGPPPEVERGVVAGVDTSIRSVELADIVFDLFNGSNLSFAEASEGTILRLVDRIPPLDSGREQLPAEVRERIGTVRYFSTEEAETAEYLWDTQLVLGYIADDGQAYAYPTNILNFHEIVNDTLGGRPVLISYCPLCRSEVVYDRRVGGRVLSFGNTRPLYQSDRVMFDRETNSYWFQVPGAAIVRPLTGERLTALPSGMAPWAVWRADHPDTLVLSAETGFARTYAADPLANYEFYVSEGNPFFPLDREFLADARLRREERVVGVDINGEARAYPLRALGTAAVNDTVGGLRVAVFIDAENRSGAVFDPVIDGRLLTFRWDGTAFLDAETGTRWDRRGRAVDGPLAGQHLNALPSRTALWFSYLSAFPGFCQISGHRDELGAVFPRPLLLGRLHLVDE